MEKSESRKIQQEANPSIKNESGNAVIQKEARTSSGNENQNELLVNDIETMFETLEPPLSAKCRIYKVPYHLRKWNNEAYTPRVISIGPIHHNKKRFQTMENTKVRYLKSFMQRAEMKLEHLVRSVREMEDSIRCCYVATVRLKSDDFVKMILLDASFILEFFLRSYEKNWEDDDPMLEEGWLIDRVWHELLLLENQLPFFVIKMLYNLALPSPPNDLSLIQLSFDFFDSLNIHKKAPDEEIEVQHFTDLLRFFQLPTRNTLPDRGTVVTFPKYTATQLNEAGVKFKVVLTKSVLDLKFEKGVLEIPLLTLEDATEELVRNIMALEQCDCSTDAYISDFYLIVDDLINTTKDVDLLCDEGIVVNWLGDSNAVTSMFNKLNKGVNVRDMNSGYNDLCKRLNEFYEVSWHRWKATLRQEYFSTPWRTASTIAAIILLMLTLIQTISSIIQVV